METRRQLDAAGRARLVVVALALAILIASPVVLAGAQNSDFRYSHGMALAQQGRWDEARAVFLDAQRQWPDDPRFPIELAGVSFKKGRYTEAVRWLRHALPLTNDPYVTDFLATVYFLQGNLEAALKYWNRIGKPRIETVKVDPGLRVDPVLLDRAFTFAPGDTLSLSGLLTTRARIDGLGICPAFRLGLDAREDGRFDATLAVQERNGFGGTKLEALASTFRGVGFQTIFPEYSNAAGSAISIAGMARWDAQKRRLMSSVSGPLGRDARRRYRIGLDLRNENWDIRPHEQAPSLGALNLTRSAAAAEISSFRTRGWSWSAGAELSHRDYRRVEAGPGLSPDLLLPGFALKQLAGVTRELWRVPEKRIETRVRVSSEATRLWSAPAHAFERLRVSFDGRWQPAVSGDDYAIEQHIGAGKIFGRAPFDELFMLGLERDNDLWLRAHIGTRDGRKGSAPLGRDYFLGNWEIDKNLYHHGFFSVKLSPFLDVARSVDSAPGLGSGKWLYDTGVQAKFRVLGVGIALVYGKDLRSGRNAIYVTTRR